MVAEDFTIQHDHRLTEWQQQSSIELGLRIIAWKMVELALLDLRRKPDGYEYQTAYDWLFGDVDFFYSFEHMCDVLKLNAVEIRRRVRAYIDSERKVPRIRKKELKARKAKVK